MTQNYPTFRDMLRGAICTRTQAQFANEAGISAEHISRMLNEDQIHRPSKNTLLKIASVAKNGITFKNLMDALDKDDNTANRPADKRIRQAQEDFKPEFREQADETMRHLCNMIRQTNFPFISSSIADATEQLIAAVQDKYGREILPIAYEIGIDRTHFGKICSHAEKWVTIYLSMADHKNTATSRMILYFSELPCTDHKTKYIIHNISCRVASIEDQYGITNDILDSIRPQQNKEGKKLPETKENADAADEESALLEKAYNLPYYLNFAPIQIFKEPMQKKGKTTEEQLLYSIFGERLTWAETIIGTGFWIKKTPGKLPQILSQHKNIVLSNYEENKWDEEERLRCRKLKHILKQCETETDAETIAEALDELEYENADCLDDQGWPSAIAEIMRAETGFPFYYHAPAKNMDEFPNLSEYGCILLSEKDTDDAGIQRETLLNTICRYAKMLDYDSFGDILFTGIREEFRKLNTYRITKTMEKTIPVLEDEPENYVPFNNKTSRPEHTGIYHVKLKDGRKWEMLYIPQQNAWVRAHKEWSHMIESYDPEPIRTDRKKNASNSKE